MKSRLVFVFAAITAIPSCNRPGTIEPASASSHALAIGSAPEEGGLLTLENHRHGTAPALRVTGMWWGRLVDVYAQGDPEVEPQLVARDLVVGEDVRSDGRDFRLDSDPVTAAESVIVLHARGSAAFADACRRLETGLVPIGEKGLAPDELPPFTGVPRNAAIVVRFDDLLDPATIDDATVEVWTGSPASSRFHTRVIADPNHGGWTERDGRAQLFPTRVIVDTTVSEIEALASSTPIVVNPRGLPAGGGSSGASCALRIPTRVDADLGRARILTNLAGRGLAPGSPHDAGATGPDELDVVRAFHAGGDAAGSHALLVDAIPPRVVGVLDVDLGTVNPDPAGGANDFIVRLKFHTLACAQAAAPRDEIRTANAIASVTIPSAAPVAGALSGVHVRLLSGGPLAVGPAQFLSPWDPAADAGHEDCFVRFTPAPASPPAAGVSPAAQVRVRFSEPMDPTSITALDTFTLSRVAIPGGPTDYVAGRMQPSVAQDEFTFAPLVPLDHVSGASESYFVTLASGVTGPTDPSGNALRDALPPTRFALAASAATLPTGSYVLRFQSTDEDNDGLPEIRGQILHDLAEGAIRPRPVTRFAAVADRTQPVPGAMPAFAPGVRTPLVPLGCRMQTVWRYCDVGMSLLDEAFTNIDVEGLDWAPVGGSVVADSYPAFEMSLAHAKRLPDEVANPFTLLPLYPQSGIVSTFAQNQLDPAEDPLRVVHPRALGYSVNPGDSFVSGTGTVMMPWPLNRNLPASQHRFYTWRNTELQAQGGPNGGGAELGIVVDVLGLPPGSAGTPFAAGQVPTIGLPLLMEFKCFPAAGATGLNAIDASIAVNTSARPNFRAFASGGVNSSGSAVVVDPDLAAVATGGFDPASFPPGAPTMGVDNVVVLGQMDLVVRVSRAHTVWIDTGSASPTYAEPVFEPAAADQAVGTRIHLAFRGATNASADLVVDAGALDAYGEPASAGSSVTYAGGDATWKTTAAAVNGARLVQMRATFVSDPATGLAPKMTGLGISFVKP